MSELDASTIVSPRLLKNLLSAIEKGEQASVSGVKTSYTAAFLAELQRKTNRRILCICPSHTQMTELVDDLHVFLTPAVGFSWHQTRPYTPVAPGNPSFSERLFALSEYVEGNAILCASTFAALHTLPPRKELEKLSMVLRVGGSCSPLAIGNTLTEWGYIRVPRITTKGEFAIRGEIIDIFPPYREEPIRMVLRFDDIESIHNLDATIELSTTEEKAVTITATSEILWTAERISIIQSHGYEKDLSSSEFVAKGDQRIIGTEYYAPLIYDSSTLSNYVTDDDLLVYIDPALVEQQATQHRDDFNRMYYDSVTMFPPPEQVVLATDSMKKATINIYPTGGEESDSVDIRIPTRYAGNIRLARTEITQLQKEGYRVVITVRSPAQRARFEQLFEDIPIVSTLLHSGFILSKEKVAVISEEDILGVSTSGHVHSVSKPIASFSDIELNTHVVHVHHGIGIFRGIKHMKAAGNSRDYLAIEYAQGDSIFVPIDQISLVQRYVGEENPRLDSIGGTSWKKRKQRIERSLEDIAKRLIELYAERESVQGHSFSADGEWQQLFESSFPFEETPDQLQALSEIKEDMESNRPMDRLLCGDVGFGKTELAIRAAFKAVMDSMQVAILAPTTILVEQHYETFCERMKNFPVRIAMLSRLVSPGKARKTLERLKQGKIDIVIGTHKLLGKSVTFAKLGFIVIDEEQRFGVKHKERLKEWKSTVDCLMMSATPIPRTLHMSMLELRKISLLRTPPKSRKPIRTIVQKFSTEIVREAIIRELDRNGQVYFLHNRIDSLEQVRRLIAEIVPTASVACIHGQMHPKDIEETMWKFLHERYNVLVSTTIIENGINIANVNTIIIDRADIYGVAQLYQLRGRVGRSDQNAYAYLLYPEQNYLSDIALRRLEIIRDHSELGVGFQIALQDMELRGVGNLVGKEQSGSVYQLGLELYLTMLNNAIRRRRNMGSDKPVQEVHIEIRHEAHIPSEYIKDIHQRIKLYQELQAISDERSLHASLDKTIDRYGAIPTEVQELFDIAKLRAMCYFVGIEEIKEIRNYISIRPHQNHCIDMKHLLASTSTQGLQLLPDGTIQYPNKEKNVHALSQTLCTFLQSISSKTLENQAMTEQEKFVESDHA